MEHPEGYDQVLLIVPMHLTVPSLNQFFIHFVSGLKRTVAMPDHIAVPQVQIRGIVNPAFLMKGEWR